MATYQILVEGNERLELPNIDIPNASVWLFRDVEETTAIYDLNIECSDDLEDTIEYIEDNLEVSVEVEG